MSAPPLAVPMTPGPAATALVIDDEPAVRAMIGRLLTRMGYGVLEAPGGQEGLELLVVRPDIAVVLLDLTMPGLGGAETLQRLRALRPALPVVIMSGYSAEEVRERLGAARRVGVLEKPFVLATLRRIVDETRGG